MAALAGPGARVLEAAGGWTVEVVDSPEMSTAFVTGGSGFIGRGPAAPADRRRLGR